jgi:hypothetical protein
MNNCGDCKHWGYEGHEDKQGNRRRCLRILVSESEASSDELAICAGDYDYGAVVLTLREFGCVLWERRGGN